MKDANSTDRGALVVKVSTLVRYGCYGANGGLLAGLGVGITHWGFWLSTAILIAAIEATKAEARA